MYKALQLFHEGHLCYTINARWYFSYTYTLSESTCECCHYNFYKNSGFCDLLTLYFTKPQKTNQILFVLIVFFYVLFVCKCVLYYCHRVATQLQLKISYQFSKTVVMEFVPMSY